LEVGYRRFQAQDVEPLFGSGFGLSYTTFDISAVLVDAPDGAGAPVTVTAPVTNTGSVAGAEAVQVYAGIPAEGQPPKRLVGFQKVFVEPGTSQPVMIIIHPAATNHAFGVWDYCSRAFVTGRGTHRLRRKLGEQHSHTATVHVG
jgi:beta-glucosidase